MIATKSIVVISKSNLGECSKEEKETNKNNLGHLVCHFSITVLEDSTDLLVECFLSPLTPPVSGC